MLDLFQTMGDSVLALLGEDAFLAGSTTPIPINIEKAVELAGIGSEQATYRGDLVVRRDIASIHAKYNPVAGQTFVQQGVTYALEHLVDDDGVFRQFVIRKIS